MDWQTDWKTDRSDWLTMLHAHGVTREETDGVQIVLSCEHTFQCHIRYWGSRARVEGTRTNTTTQILPCALTAGMWGVVQQVWSYQFMPDLGLIPRLHAHTIVWGLDCYTWTCLSCLCIELVSLILVRPLICSLMVVLLEPKLLSRDLAFQCKWVPKD